MLKKKEKISRKVFNEIFNTSRVISRGSFFMVKKAINPLKDNEFHASVVISKKIAKKAHERNYLKRCLYSLIQQHKKMNPLFLGTYICIYQKKPIKMHDLQVDFDTQFKS